MNTHTHTTPLKTVFKSSIPIQNEAVLVVPKIIHHQNIHLAQRREMLEKYRNYVQQYANACPLLNRQVTAYNNTIDVEIQKNALQVLANKETEAFKDTISKVSTTQYNEAAKAWNLKLKQPLVKLKKHQPIKKSTEHVFSMIIFKYAMQIDEKNKILIGCGANTMRGLQKVKINHYELANTVIDDVLTLPYCKRTIHNHINRLVEAGVLFDYTFKGREKPVEYYVNSQILTIFCNKIKKSFTSENQLFTFQFAQSLHNNEIDTRTLKNKKEIIVPVNKQSQVKGVETPSSLLPLFQFSEKENNQSINQNTNQRKQLLQEQTHQGRENFPKISSYLFNALEDTQFLMEDLASGTYKNYRFVNRHQLEKEVYQGVMPKAEFRELLLQVFVKMAAPIWANSTPTVASWRKAYNIINEDFLLNPNGSIPNKAALIYLFDNLVYRITYAKRFFNKFKTFNPLYPSQYFDPTRKEKKSGGFAYTVEALKKHQKSHENRQKRKEIQNKEAQNRNYKLKAIELVEKQVNKLKNGKITIPELHDYVSNNAHIPQEIKANLPKYIQRIYTC